ncbi:MAG: tRNA pseudouridine(55) synthase TruB [Saprospiraceae bacterium]
MILTALNLDQIDFWEGSVLLVDKPYGYTSFNVVYEIKKAICRESRRKLKIGHAGTLDPLATGLLILCTGKLTKEIDQYQAKIKKYTGALTLGATRPTFDKESEIDQNYEVAHIQKEDMENVRLSFLGEQMMTPPIHSAVKVGGKRAYELARQGKEPILNPKAIIIEDFQIDCQHFPEIHFEVTCSKGTYIRSLASEFGKRLNSGAYLSFLRREAIGEYSVQDAWNLQELKKFLNHSRER